MYTQKGRSLRISLQRQYINDVWICLSKAAKVLGVAKAVAFFKR